jgi:ankyrin repeat protein
MSVGEKKSQAIVMLEKMAEQEPMDAFIKQVWMMSKVAFLITHQDYLEAKILAIKVTKNFPYHLKGWLDLATVHLALGEGKPAKACLEKGTQYCASTSLIQQRKEYARLLMQFGLLEEAESVIATFFEEAAEIGERDENERIDIFPERYQLRGCLQSKQGKQEAAYIDIKEYLILSASDYPSVLSYALSWDLFELAYYAIKYELTSGGKASKKGITPLMLACGNEKSDMVRLLIECTDVNSCLVGEELTALHIACSQDDFTCVETLLKHPEVKVNLAQKDGFTPLMYACTRGYVNYVRALLAVPGIDINAQDKLEGNTALTIACAFGHADIVKLLLKEQEVKIDQTNYPGGTPLFYAIISESVKCVGLLLKKKASIKAVSLDVGRANSVFQVFCQTNKDNPQLLQKRLEKLWFHHPKGEERVKAFLRQLQSPASSEESSIVQIKLLWQAYALRNISIMERLIDAGCLLEEVDEEGLTLLARACGDGEQQIVELLIEKGAKVNATIETESYQGLTALHLACEQGHLACIQALLARPEIDVNVVEKKYGLMPLMIACVNSGRKLIPFS